ncbi:MAG: TetR/AcrR family transcriptional regulator [Oscillospiraceae bacterium]|jgi:AcrR family transcriptional regulator|nr:TetR/AcrR family transcriptional regulator [Oscillospiraceae bacterium]
MKKGDTRREQILTVAESLFYRKGFEQTSIQDILEALHLSKGGLYHHFTSKLALLEAICAMRADESFEAAQEAIERHQNDPVAALNALLDKGSVFRADKLDYVGLLLRVAYREDGALMRETLKQTAMERTRPLIDQVIAEGVAQKLFILPRPRLAGEMILRLCHQFTDEVALILLGGGEEAEQITAILEKLELYRYAVERLLGAPFGSVLLYDMQNLAAVCRGLAQRSR